MIKYSYYFIFFTLYVFLFSACNDDKESTNSESMTDNQIQSRIKNRIIGKWGGLGEATPVWDIRKDSIYYFQHSKSYAYKIIDRNMVFYYENNLVVFKDIHVRRDTLFFIDDIGISVRAFRFK